MARAGLIAVYKVLNNLLPGLMQEDLFKKATAARLRGHHLKLKKLRIPIIQQLFVIKILYDFPFKVDRVLSKNIRIIILWKPFYYSPIFITVGLN